MCNDPIKVVPGQECQHLGCVRLRQHLLSLDDLQGLIPSAGLHDTAQAEDGVKRHIEKSRCTAIPGKLVHEYSN